MTEASAAEGSTDLRTDAGFALAFLVFAARPGPDNLTIVSKTASEGAARGIAYGCGMVASIAGFVVLAALGFDALAGALGDHLRLARRVGAAYLVYTGVAMWRAPTASVPRAVRGGRVVRPEQVVHPSSGSVRWPACSASASC